VREEDRAGGGQESEMAILLGCLSRAQANENGWPIFKGKYVEYPRFRKEWWAYRRTYHGHIRDKLVSRALKEKSLTRNARSMANDIEDLQEIWDTLDTCCDRPEKYIAEALEPVIKFRKYRVFEHGAIREFHLLLRSAMMEAKRAGLLRRLINDQTLPVIMAQMPQNDWRGQGATVMDQGRRGGRLLGLHGPEVEGLPKRGGRRTSQLGP
jgi:hypothetical protein